MRWMLLSMAVVLVPAAPAWAQDAALKPGASGGPLALTLDEAITLAEARSEQIAIAQAGATRSRADERRAKSELFPQVFASGSYDRTLASEFSGISFGSPSDGSDAGFDFSELPFGRKNVYRLNLSVSQNLYTGGRVSAQRRLAATGREIADIAVDSSRAQTVLDVTQAFFDAALADRLVAIAEATLQQAEATLARVRLGRETGRQPEFDLLRAQVERDTQVPVVIRVRSQRALAYLRLKQLLEIPPAQDVQTIYELEGGELKPPARFAEAVAPFEAGSGEVDSSRRAPVRQSEIGIRARLATLEVTRSQRLPTVSLNTLLGPVAYPDNLSPFTEYRTNWTVGVSASLPLFTGGRIAAEEAVARADLLSAEAQLKQLREYAELDARSAVEELVSAKAAWEASAGTVQQAQRAYEIAELRYREGISTQLELSDSRLLLQQAQANRAVAGRDLQVARARVALLPYLPLGQTGGLTAVAAATGNTGAAAAAGAALAAQARSRATGTAAGTAGSRTGGGGF